MDIHLYASEGNYHGVRTELEKLVSVEVRDGQDYTPLAYAASSSNADEEMVRLLIDAGADVNAAVGERKKHPIGLAACSGSIEKVQLLLDAGANIKFESPKGYTILINVTYALLDDEKLVPMIEWLVKNGAEIDCETDYGESPLSVASHGGRFDAVKWLLDAGADPTPLQWSELLKSVALGTCDDVQRLVEQGSDLEARDRWERTPWLLATLIGDVEKAKLLLTAGANISDRERGGHTALMNCAARGNKEMLQWLIEIGADIKAVDDSENTAFMLAAQAGTTDCARLLLDAGADPSRSAVAG